MAVVFVTKLENGNKINEGLCIQCAKELGVPVDNMLGNVMNQLGITPEQLENMEKDINDYIGEMGDNLPSDWEFDAAEYCRWGTVYMDKGCTKPYKYPGNGINYTLYVCEGAG